jgi:hypothetical protein
MGYNESMRQAMQEQPTCEAIGPRAELDTLVAGLTNEIYHYGNNLEGLLCRLEAPRPECADPPQTPPQSMTIQNAMQLMIGKLAIYNEIFGTTLKRIDNEVGDLKILP